MPAAVVVAAFCSLGIAALVAEFTLPEQRDAAIWWMLAVFGGGVVLCAPALYWIVRKFENIVRLEIEARAKASVPDLATTVIEAIGPEVFTAEVREGANGPGFPWQLVTPEKRHAAVAAIYFAPHSTDARMDAPESGALALNEWSTALEGIAFEHGGTVARLDDGEAILLFLADGSLGAAGRAGNPELAATRAVQALLKFADVHEDAGRGQVHAAVVSGLVGLGVMRRRDVSYPAVFGGLIALARALMAAAKSRGVDLLVSTAVEVRLGAEYRLLPLGAIPEIIGHQGVHAFVVDVPGRRVS